MLAANSAVIGERAGQRLQLQPVLGIGLPDQLADEGRRQQHRPGLHRLPQRTDGEIRRPFENIQDRGRRIGLRRRTVVFQRLAGLAGQRICQRVDLQDLPFLLQNVRSRDRQRERRQQQ